MLDREELLENFSICSLTGDLLWKKNKRKKLFGKVAGSVFCNRDGGTKYRRLKIEGKSCFAHRIVWVMSFGQIESGLEIDHKDGNGLNNKISNLRLVRHQGKNCPKQKNNTSGFNGVHKTKRGMFAAKIWNNNKQIWLGHFETIEEAITARKCAEVLYGYHKNHGRENQTN